MWTSGGRNAAVWISAKRTGGKRPLAYPNVMQRHAAMSETATSAERAADAILAKIEA